MIARLLLVAALALAGCQAEQAEDQGPPDLSGFDPQAAAHGREACEKRGGTWSKSGAEGAFLCFTPTRDANKHCTKESDCDGLCLARSQTCAPIKPFIGCHEILTDLGVRATLCTD